MRLDVEMQRLVEIMVPRWSPIVAAELWKRNPSKHMRELQQKTKKIISKSVSALSVSLSLSLSLLLLLLLLLSVYLKGSTQLILFLQRLVGRVEANKLFISEPTDRVCVLAISSHFLTVRLQRGSDRNLRRSATLIDYLEQWCYSCL